MTASVLKHDKLTLERAQNFISKSAFTDCNLTSKLVSESRKLEGIWSSTCKHIVKYEDMLKLDFKVASVGDSFGPSWSTVWFRVEICVPDTWKGREVCLLWECEGEATVWRDGQPVQGLSIEAERTTYVVYDNYQHQPANVTLHIEMSCNALFGAGKGSLVAPPDPDRTFKVTKAEVVLFDPLVRHLLIDLDLLAQIAKSVSGQRGKQAMFTANHIINTLVLHTFSPPALTQCRRMAMDFLRQRNGDSQHTLHAVGHCHLDTAWLWPMRETVRKCCRSFSTTLDLFDKYPHFVFVCSQAQQFSWMKDEYPGLYARITHQVQQGRFKPVGGVWVEMDANLPSGESLIRQFMKGQQFFKQEFNVTCNEFWLPDTFGYSAQLPQIIKGCGMERFVTQKLSWSFFNKFPHHTFIWHGIDDSQVLVHFPPGDSYAMTVTVDEMLKTLNNSEDQGRTNHSLFLFGFGDGGQGPTAENLEKISRLQDVDGLPKLRLSDVDTFFEEVSKPSLNFPYLTHMKTNQDKHIDSQVERETGRGEDKEIDGETKKETKKETNEMLCHWKGELFLELHNGTYTTQAQIKKRNREAEGLMHRLESFVCMVRIHTSYRDFDMVRVEMDALWKDVLLNQFHDILPGSGIAMVYEDAHKLYDGVFRRAAKLWEQLTNVFMDKTSSKDCGDEHVMMNMMGWGRDEVVEVDEDFKLLHDIPSQNSLQNPQHKFCLFHVEGMSLTIRNQPPSITSPCHISQNKDGSFKMGNGLLSVVVDECGRLTALHVASSTRNALRGLGNQLVLYDDVPLYWDAWDVMAYHTQTRQRQDKVTSVVKVVEEGVLRVVLEVKMKIGSESSLEQKIILDANCPYLKFQTKVDWKESHKLLKVEFETDVLTREATYEIQFGSLQRPNHGNTSWDMAQYEVCGHKWADVSEEGFGLAVLNDCKYGWSCFDNRLCLSLLRSPKNPDASADMGVHHFVYAVMPHKGSWQKAEVVQAAHNLNNPLITFSSSMHLNFNSVSFIQVSHPSVVLSAFKMSEKSSDSVVVRLFECHGGCSDVKVTFKFDLESMQRCNMLEECCEKVEHEVVECCEKVEHGVVGEVKEGRFVKLSFKAFQVITLLLKLKPSFCSHPL